MGAGFTGVKGHKPPGFLCPAMRWMDERDGFIKLSSHCCANSELARDGASEENSTFDTKKKQKNNNTRNPFLFFLKEGFKDTSKDRVACAPLLSPPPQREKQHKRCSRNFMHHRTFCLCKRVAKRTAEGTTSAGEGTQRHGGVFCAEGRNSFKKMAKSQHKPKVGRLQLSPFVPAHTDACGQSGSF